MKICPYCSEKIQNTARKCKHCGEWLSEEEIKGELVERKDKLTSATNSKIVKKHKRDYKKKPNIFVSIIRYILFVLVVIIAIVLFHILTFIGLRLLSGLNLFHRIILIFILGGLLIGLLNFFVTGITYATHYILKIVPNYKYGGVIFTVLIIILTIWQIIECFTAPIWTQETGNFLRVVFILLIVGMCILLSVLVNNKEFEHEV